MANANLQFDKRVRRIVRGQSRRAANGAVLRMNSDGLIEARPRRRGPRFPLKGLVLLIGAGMLFKGFLLAHLGGIAYSERVGILADGTIVEQAGAWIMQPDPVTLQLAEWIGQVLPPL